MELATVAALITELGAQVEQWPEGGLGGHALAYAAAGWEVFPLHPHDCACADTPKRQGCATDPSGRGKRPHTARGLRDATSDPNSVAGWWSRWPQANIGARVPAGLLVVDVDPRHGGDVWWQEQVDEHGGVDTRTALSGREDGGMHLYFRHPGGRLTAPKGVGVDLKTHGGYVVVPPSRHAATGAPYRWVDTTTPIRGVPRWLRELLQPAPRGQRTAPQRPLRGGPYGGDSVADWFTATSSWHDVLGPHGWRCNAGDGDSDGSSWLHPAATSSCSATVRHGMLFVYSSNTPFEVTGVGDAHGYTRFRAWAVLDHGGDLAAAARAAAQLRKEAA